MCRLLLIKKIRLVGLCSKLAFLRVRTLGPCQFERVVGKLERITTYLREVLNASQLVYVQREWFDRSLEFHRLFMGLHRLNFFLQIEIVFRF